MRAVPTGRRPGARRRVVSRVPRGDHPLHRGGLRLLRRHVDDATSFSLEQPFARVRHPDDPRCFQPALVGTVVPGRPPRPTWSLHLRRGWEAKHRTDLLLAAYTHASQAPDKQYGVSRDSTVLARMHHFCGVGLPTAMPSDRAVMSLLSTPGSTTARGSFSLIIEWNGE